MSPCQFLSNGEVKRTLVAATAFARATPLVLLAELVRPDFATLALVLNENGVRLAISSAGMTISRAKELLSVMRLFVSERMRPVIRSPFLSSRETVCANALQATSPRPVTSQFLLWRHQIIGLCDARR